MSLPLCLTLVRVLLGPLFLVLYIYAGQWGASQLTVVWMLIGVAVISELSDLLDGRLARKRNKVTELGKLLDPMADSIFRFSVLFAFTQGVIGLPLILVILFFYRDVVIGTLRTVCALRGFALAARLSGKIKAVIQAVVIFFILILMIPYSMGCLGREMLRALSFYAVLISVIYTLYSGVEYLIANRSYIRKGMGASK
ncbi:MAG: CDP-diacylglycerol-glycerol-3-phosphate 3-phosphatidyltransferase [Chlamydiota bacterium]